MTIWLAVYLGIGVIVLGTMLPAYLRECPSKWARLMMEEIQPERRSIRNRLLGDFVAPTLAAVFVVAVWPVALVFIIRGHLKRRARQSDDDDMNEDEPEDRVEPGWKVTVEHLGQPVSAEEIVARERVDDPLGAVMQAPFGFLHFRWVDFITQQQPGDELWTFEVPTMNFDYRRRGYAIVRAGVPVESFVTDIIEE
jgi:hypothetical protein